MDPNEVERGLMAYQRAKDREEALRGTHLEREARREKEAALAAVSGIIDGVEGRLEARVLYLRHVSGLDWKSVAVEMGMSRSTVHTRYRRALQQAAASLDEAGRG